MSDFLGVFLIATGVNSEGPHAQSASQLSHDTLQSMYESMLVLQSSLRPVALIVPHIIEGEQKLPADSPSRS